MVKEQGKPAGRAKRKEKAVNSAGARDTQLPLVQCHVLFRDPLGHRRGPHSPLGSEAHDVVEYQPFGAELTLTFGQWSSSLWEVARAVLHIHNPSLLYGALSLLSGTQGNSFPPLDNPPFSFMAPGLFGCHQHPSKLRSSKSAILNSSLSFSLTL